jgi:hypothetical protein
MSEKNVQVRCPVCGIVMLCDSSKMPEHVNRMDTKKQTCYGSKLPVMAGLYGDFFPGELIYPNPNRRNNPAQGGY